MTNILKLRMKIDQYFTGLNSRVLHNLITNLIGNFRKNSTTLVEVKEYYRLI